MHTFDYQRVNSLQEALDAASAARGTAVFMAGGTDLLVRVKNGNVLPERIIDIKGIREMDGCEAGPDEFSMGSLISMRTLETSLSVLQTVPLLAQAAGKLGSIQVRHRATLGGNLCNASPSAESAPALLALDARVTITGKSSARTLDLRDFFLGPGATVLAGDEILTRVSVPLTRNRQGSVYYKLSTRNAMDLAFVSVAVLLELDGKDRISKARIALGAVAPTPIRVPSAEKHLEGRTLTHEVALESARIAERSCRPISDLRASAEYRREMVRELCERGLLTAYGRAKSLTEDWSR